MVARLFAAFRKDAPAVGDVHAATALGNQSDKRKARPFKAVIGDTLKCEWSVAVPVMKTDDETRTAYGWASVTEIGGQTVTDLQGDQIETADLVKAAHDFMLASRQGGDMHEVVGIGRVVESMVFTPEAQKSLGIELGKVGWYIAMKIDDEAVWKRVKAGELAAFSIGGVGQRHPL